jgi:hypothetical protein
MSPPCSHGPGGNPSRSNGSAPGRLSTAAYKQPTRNAPASSRPGTVADSTAPVPPRPPGRLPAGRPAASWRAPVLACAPRAAPRPASFLRGEASSRLRPHHHRPSGIIFNLFPNGPWCAHLARCQPANPAWPSTRRGGSAAPGLRGTGLVAAPAGHRVAGLVRRRDGGPGRLTAPRASGQIRRNADRRERT